MTYDCVLYKELYVGDIESVSEEPTDKFKTIVSVCQDKRDANVGCEYKQFPLADDFTSKKNWGGTIDYEDFRDACEYVRRFAEPPVLVHCHSGQNRSVSVVTAVVAVARDMSYKEAYEIVRTCRTQANNNDLMELHARRYIDEYR